MTDAAKIKALSNIRRLKIIDYLSDGEQSVTELMNKTKLSQSSLSQHLAILRACGIVNTRRDAQNIFYRIADIKFADIARHLLKI